MELNTLEVTEQPEGFRFTSIRELVNQTLNETFGSLKDTPGVSSGFKKLDKALGGFQKGKMYTVAVKPGMGKTAFLLSLANNMAVKNDHTVAIFSSERSNVKMTRRLIESETGMSVQKLQSGDLRPSEKDHMLSVLSNIAKAKIFIDDTQGLSIGTFAKNLQYFCKLEQPDLVIIDYLELLHSGQQGEQDMPSRYAQMMENIKGIASNLQVPVLLFSQSAGNINGGYASGRPPLKVLPDFLNEHSDVLMLLHRKHVLSGSNGSAGGNPVELIISMQQHEGEEVVVPLQFIESTAKFTDPV